MKSVLSIILFISIFSCSTQKEVYVDNPQVLRFGSAGGFTSQAVVYKLQSNGKLWKYGGIENDSTELNQLKKSQTRKLFEQAYQLGLDTLNLYKPGNMNNFIQIKSKTMDNKIVWPKGNPEVPIEIPDFYKTLMSYTNEK